MNPSEVYCCFLRKRSSEADEDEQDDERNAHWWEEKPEKGCVGGTYKFLVAAAPARVPNR
jgi:hypothetical protein